MTRELKFASTDAALQHLANVTGKRVAVSENAEEQLWYLIQYDLKELIENAFKQAKRDEIDESKAAGIIKSSIDSVVEKEL